jgi:segregation and condensation protein B
VEEERLKAIIESLLFASAEPVALSQLATVIENVARDDIKRALGEMAVGYAAGGRGIVLEEVANGYQLRTPKEHASYVRKLLSAKPPRLSRPLLETVAIVAYRQPITRPEIEQLRGVDCGGVIDTLVERRLIHIAGRKEAPGRPIMYTTTREFLELFGLKDLSGLPDLEELRMVESPREEPLFANNDSADPSDVLGDIQAAGVSAASGVRESDLGVAARPFTDEEATAAAFSGEFESGESVEETDSAENETLRSSPAEKAAASEAATDAHINAAESAAEGPHGESAALHPFAPSAEPEDHD